MSAELHVLPKKKNQIIIRALNSTKQKLAILFFLSSLLKVSCLLSLHSILNLFLFSMQDGNDTTAIQRKLKELQKSIHTAKSRIRSGPPRIAPPGSTSVDRRPTTICVTGFELDESDIILGHFKVRFVKTSCNKLFA